MGDQIKKVGNEIVEQLKQKAKSVIITNIPWIVLGGVVLLIIMTICGMFITVEAQAVSSTNDYSMYNIENGRYVKNSATDKIWNALIDLGYSEYHAASVLGNIVWESSCDTSARNDSSGAYGLGQWLDTRYTGLTNYASEKNKAISDEDIQVNYLIAEITGQGDAASYAVQRTVGGLGELKYTNQDWENATNFADAAVIFCWYFETPSLSSTRGDFERDQEEKRIASTKAYYEAYTGKTISLPSGGGGAGVGVVDYGEYKVVANSIKIQETAHANNYDQDRDQNTLGDKCLGFAFIYAGAINNGGDTSKVTGTPTNIVNWYNDVYKSTVESNDKQTVLRYCI